MERMIRYLCDLFEEEPRSEPRYVLDIGTGNGHLLFALVEAQEEDLAPGTVDPSRLCGIDYSPASIQLCHSIAQNRGNECKHISFLECDLRDMSSMDTLTKRANDGQGWDVVCDKGTVCIRLTDAQYDAVCY